MFAAVAVLAALAVLPQSLALNVCTGRQFGYKVPNPDNCQGYFLCIGSFGALGQSCGLGYTFCEEQQRCIISKCNKPFCSCNYCSELAPQLSQTICLCGNHIGVLNPPCRKPLTTTACTTTAFVTKTTKNCKDTTTISQITECHTTPLTSTYTELTTQSSPEPTTTSTPPTDEIPTTVSTTTDLTTPSSQETTITNSRELSSSTSPPSSSEPSTEQSTESSTTEESQTPTTSITITSSESSTTEETQGPTTPVSITSTESSTTEETQGPTTPISTTSSESSTTEEPQETTTTEYCAESSTSTEFTTVSTAPTTIECKIELSTQPTTESSSYSSTQTTPKCLTESTAVQTFTDTETQSSTFTTASPTPELTSTTECVETTKVSKCKPEPPNCRYHQNGVYIRDANLCRVFYICSNGVAIRQTCPPGLYFDNKAFVCNFESMVQCEDCRGTAGTSSAIVTKVTDPPCTTQTPTPFCEIITTTKACNIVEPPTTTVCSSKNHEKGFASILEHYLCENAKNGELIADPIRCNKYYVCQNGKARTHFCKPGQWFDKERFVCDSKNFVKNCFSKTNLNNRG